MDESATAARRGAEESRAAGTTLRILTDTITVAGWTAAAKVLGAVKILIAARLFGAGDAMDAFLVAFLVPAFIGDVVAAPLETALIPAFMRIRQDSRRAAEELYSQVLVTTVLFLAALAVISACLVWPILSLLAASFAPDKLAYTRFLLLVMLPVMPLSGAWVAARSVLNADRRFAVAAALPMITPALSIALLLAGGREWGVSALAVATTVGVLMQVMAGMALVRLSGYRVVAAGIGFTQVRTVIGTHYFPLMAISLVAGAALLIDQSVAARLEPGSVSALNYGTRLTAVLLALGPVAAGTAVLPHIASMMATGEAAAAIRNLTRFAALMLVISSGAVAALVAASEPLLRFVLRSEAFDDAGMSLLAAVQSVSLLQVPLAILIAIGIRVIVAMNINRVLYGMAVLSIALTLALDLLLIRWWGLLGIPAAGACVRLVAVLYLFSKIRRLRHSAPPVTASYSVS
jgi:putative peptidoglycan lipid II flippase